MLSPAIFAQDFSCFQKLRTHFLLLLLTSTLSACTTGLRTICVSGSVVRISGNIAVSQRFRLKLTLNRFCYESEEIWAGLVAKGDANEPVSKFLNSSTCRMGNNVNSKIATVHATRNLEERLMCARVFQDFAKNVTSAVSC